MKKVIPENINEEVLLKEYEIIQDKIDKIGSFKFVIKGWALTLVPAATIGLFSLKNFSPFYVLPLTLIPLSFPFMEDRQSVISKILGDRAVDLEWLIHSLNQPYDMHDRKKVIFISQAFSRVNRVPGIAVTLRREAQFKLSYIAVFTIKFWKKHVFYFFLLSAIMAVFTASLLNKSRQQESSDKYIVLRVNSVIPEILNFSKYDIKKEPYCPLMKKDDF